MARGSRMKIVRNPTVPRKSVISDRPGGGKNDIDLVDIGAPPIPRYGVVYITTIEAQEIAAFMGWIDGDIVREKLGKLEAENRALRAQVAALPLLINETSERFKDGLDSLARDLTAGYGAALADLRGGDPEALPGWADTHRPAVELGDSGRDAHLARIDGAGAADAGEDVGGQQVGDGGAADGDTGVDEGAAAGGGAPARDVEAADGGDARPSIAELLTHGAGDRPAARITDLDADDDDQAAGNP